MLARSRRLPWPAPGTAAGVPSVHTPAVQPTPPRIADDRHARRQPADDEFRPLAARRRILILLLAVATALVVMFMLIERPGGVHPPARAASQPGLPDCRPGQTSGCVGGLQPLTVVPPPAAAL